MSNQVLDSLAVEEIRQAMLGLRGSVAKYTAEYLAKHFEVSVSQIYEVTRDWRPARKRRADRGTRTAALLEHDGLRFAAELVVLEGVNAKDALAKVQLEGYDVPVSLGTFRRYLREHQVRRARLKPNKTVLTKLPEGS
jgi:transposase